MVVPADTGVWQDRGVRHVFHCPLRWADLDLLGHVNNVTYVDYLQEARIDLFRTLSPGNGGASLVDGAVVVRHEVTYVSSLTFRLEAVAVETWVSDVSGSRFTLEHEIYDEDDDGTRTVYLRASTVLAPYDFRAGRTRPLSTDESAALTGLFEKQDASDPVVHPPVVDLPGGQYPVYVRYSDVDQFGHVDDVPYFTYFQEARIVLMMHHHRGVAEEQGLHLVVARTDIDYLRPMVLRAEPYECRTWVAHVGRTSVVFESVISDGDRELARGRVVGVAVSQATGRPAPVPDVYRDLVAVE